MSALISPVTPPTIVDAHVHLWGPGLEREWLASVPGLPANADAADYRKAAVPGSSALLVESGVAPHHRLAEARELSVQAASVAGTGGVAGAVVAGPPLDTGLDSGLEFATRYLDVATAPAKVRGLRTSADELRRWPPGLAAEVRRRSLSLDLLAGWTHDGLLAELERLPDDQPVVLDHALAPPVAQGWGSSAADAWALTLRRAADREATVVKLSGLATLVPRHLAWQDAARPFALAVLECFGAARALFGSDWPMTTVRDDATPNDCLDFVHDLLGPGGEWLDVAGGTAVRTYGISSEGTTAT